MTNEPKFHRARTVTLMLAVTATLAGCAGVPAPNDQISLSQSAVASAMSADATQFAPMEMKTAQDKMFLMERAMGERDYVKARSLAEQIEVDAKLAERKATAVKWQQQLQQSEAGVQVLKQEMLQAPAAGLTPSAGATE